MVMQCTDEVCYLRERRLCVHVQHRRDLFVRNVVVESLEVFRRAKKGRVEQERINPTTVWALPPQQTVLSSSCPLESHLPPGAGQRTERKTVGQGIACDNCDFQGPFGDLPHQ